MQTTGRTTPGPARTGPTDAKRALRPPLRAARMAHAQRLATPMLPVPCGFAALVAGRIVAGYAAAPGEADPALLLDAARDAGATVLLPHVPARGAAMRFVPEGPLRPGPYGVAQPDAADAPPPDVVLAPLLAFDDGGRRLGQGGGHYDRALAALPDALVIGVAFAMQRHPALPADPWDRPLAAILTEHGLTRFKDITA